MDSYREVYGDYVWSQPDLLRLVNLAESLRCQYLEKDEYIHGVLERDGANKTRTIVSSLPEWQEEAGKQERLASASLDLGKYDARMQIRFDSRWTGGGCTLYIVIRVPRDSPAENDAQMALQKAVDELGLCARDAPKTNAPSRHREMHRYYTWPKPDPSRLASWVSQEATAYIGGGSDVSGRVESTGTPTISTDVNAVDDWLSVTSAPWKSAQVSVQDPGGRRRVTVYLQAEDDGASLSVHIDLADTADEEARAMSLLSALQSALQLEDADRNSHAHDHLVGFEAAYTSVNRIDMNWVRTTLLAVQVSPGNVNVVDAWYQLASNSTHAILQRDLDSWVRDISEQWGNVSRFGCAIWMKGDTIRVRFTCDPRREIVELTLEAPDSRQLETIRHDLEKKIGIQQIPGELFREPKSVADLRITGWRNKKFAGAIRTVIDQFFLKTPVAAQAWVIEKHNDRLAQMTCRDLEEFVQRVGSSQSYTEAHLVMEGIQGAAMGIHVEDNLSRFILRSTLEGNDFDDLTRVFRSALKLKPGTEEGESDRASDEKKTSRWITVGLPLLTLIMGSAVGFVFSEPFARARSAVTTVHITLPSKPPGAEPNDIVVIKEDKFPVEWVQETEQWFRKKTLRDEKATIRILRERLYETQRLSDVAPGEMLALNNGLYDIEVIVASNESDRVTVRVEKVSVPATGPSPP